MSHNLQHYWDLLPHQETASHRAQIYLFPEDGLYGDEFVPLHNVTWPLLQNFQIALPSYDESGSVNLCQRSQHPTLQKIACEAQRRSVWMLVNLADIQQGSRYNTLLVVDPQGRFQGKYHKRHLFPDDLALFSPGESRTQTFQVNGQTFGLLICFDIFFFNPTHQLLQQGVKDFIFSTYWVNTGTVPYISAVHLQQAFSRAYNVRLYASNMNTGFIDSGSGIYDSGHPVAYTFNTNPNQRISKVLRSDGKVFESKGEKVLPAQRKPRFTPLHTHSSSQEQKPFLRPFTAEAGHTYNFEYSNQNGDNLYCSLNMSISSASVSGEAFAFVAYTGNFFEPLPVQLCGLIRCKTIEACFTDKFELSSQTVFDHLDLNIRFDDSRGVPSTPAFPIIATHDAQLLDVDTFQVNSESGSSMNLQHKQTTILNAFMFKSFA